MKYHEIVHYDSTVLFVGSPRKVREYLLMINEPLERYGVISEKFEDWVKASKYLRYTEKD